MLLLLADENFNNDIVRGVRRRLASVDVVRRTRTWISPARTIRLF